MNRTSILDALEHITRFLSEDGAILIEPLTREALLEKAEKLREKAKKPGESLYVGILGGTGVGKSTLINALAGKQISQSSDRRPYTDRAVIYRHRDTARGLDEITGLVRDPDALHDSESVRDLILLDLPDFDSTQEQNRIVVEKILPFLDAAVWVVTPEKYADSAFYGFLNRTVIHRENFTFILNKSDELIHGDTQRPYERLKEVLGDLAFRLKHEANIEQPRLFSISAAQQYTGDSDPILSQEFSKFHDYLMAKRDAKEIASVKTINLLEELRHITREIDSAANPVEKLVLSGALRSLSNENIREPAKHDLLSIEHEDRIAESLFTLLVMEDESIVPVTWGMRLLTIGRSFKGESVQIELDRTFDEAARNVGKSRKMLLEKISANVRSELLLSLTQTSGDTVIEPSIVMDDSASRASAVFAGEVNSARSALAGFRATWRKFWQKAVLWFPAFILAIKLAGPEKISLWLDSPTIDGALRIMLAFLTNIFGPEGLTGLAALMICELFLIWYLASRRLKRLKKITRRLASRAVNLIDEHFDAAVTQVTSNTTALLERVDRSIHKLDELHAYFSRELKGTF
jgi:GTP-binding protein EngB required for normal cell division